MEKKISKFKDNKLTKLFLNQSRSQKITTAIMLVLLGVSALATIYILLTVSTFSLISIYSAYLKPLGFNYITPFSHFFLIFGLQGIGFFIYFLFRGKINWYLFFAIALILFLFIFGLSFIGSSYNVDLPSSQYWEIRNIEERNAFIEECTFSRLDCVSVRGKQYFVDGDEVFCIFSIPEECNFFLKDYFEVRKVYLNSEEELKINVSISKKQASFQIKIEKGLKALWVIPYFSNENKTMSPFYVYWEFEDVYSDEEYSRRQSEKSSLLIALVSLSIFSSIIAMNNLKQLFESKK